MECKNCKKELETLPDWGMLNINEFCSNKCSREYNNKFYFISFFKAIQNQVHEIAIQKGWWDKDVEVGTKIALIHSELSEGLEALRKNKQSDKISGFLGIEEELADVIIRIMDDADRNNWRVAEALIAKMEYNENREYRHGNKEF